MTMQFLANSTLTVGAYVDAAGAFRKTVTEGEAGDPTPHFRANIAVSLPLVIPNGMFIRLDANVGVIRKSHIYTPETDAACGINISPHAKANLGGRERIQCLAKRDHFNCLRKIYQNINERVNAFARESFVD